MKLIKLTIASIHKQDPVFTYVNPDYIIFLRRCDEDNMITAIALMGSDESRPLFVDESPERIIELINGSF